MEQGVQRQADMDVVTVVPVDADIHWCRDGKAEYAFVIIPRLDLRDGESYHLTILRRGRRHGRVLVRCQDEQGQAVEWTTDSVGAAKRRAEQYVRHRFQAHASAVGMSPGDYIAALLQPVDPLVAA